MLSPKEGSKRRKTRLIIHNPIIAPPQLSLLNMILKTTYKNNDLTYHKGPRVGYPKGVPIIILSNPINDKPSIL